MTAPTVIRSSRVIQKVNTQILSRETAWTNRLHCVYSDDDIDHESESVRISPAVPNHERFTASANPADFRIRVPRERAVSTSSRPCLSDRGNCDFVDGLLPDQMQKPLHFADEFLTFPLPIT
jgi:hypothetical protein